jgi:hypothetical protein
VWIVPRTAKARTAQRIGIVVAILMVLFPPWMKGISGFRYYREEFAGYYPLWWPRDCDGIIFSLLFLQLLIAAIITKTAVRFLNQLPE